MMKRLLRIVELTGPEQRVVVFVLCALVAFVTLKAYRDAAKHQLSSAQPAVVADQPSPSPGIRP